jgi:purine-cytosine permease-like protein
MRSLPALLVAAYFGWLVISALRTGRANAGVQRHSHPIMYWMSIVTGTFLALAFLAVGLELPERFTGF